jgi:hypothetical protein
MKITVFWGVTMCNLTVHNVSGKFDSYLPSYMLEKCHSPLREPQILCSPYPPPPNATVAGTPDSFLGIPDFEYRS